MATVTEIHTAANRLEVPVRAPIVPGWQLWATRTTVAAVLIPRLPALLWWLVTRSALYQRGWVNLEYLALLCIALLWPSWGTVGLLTAEMCFALVEPIAHLYYFHSGDILFSLRYLKFIPVHRLVEYGALLVLYGGCCAAALRWALGRHRDPRNRGAAAVIACCIAVFACIGLKVQAHPLESRESSKDIRRRKLVRTPVTSLIVAMHAYSGDTGGGPGDVPLVSALSQAIRVAPAHTQPDIVLAVVESWGLANEKQISAAQTAPYNSPELTARYQVLSGTVPFDGATTSGETRELCGNADGIASLRAQSEYFASCWPAQLKREGYRTVAVHGFTPTMYHRETWYSHFGFDQTIFQPQLLRDGGSMCDGAFPGVCDADVARWIGQHALQPSGQAVFVHWVTLSSHLPVPPVTSAGEQQRCATDGVAGEEGLCSWFNLILHAHQSVAQLALDAKRPTLLVVVGDHAPPFLEARTRGRFSQTRVPYVILMPRSLGPAGATVMVSAADDARPADFRRHHSHTFR